MTRQSNRVSARWCLKAWTASTIAYKVGLLVGRMIREIREKRERTQEQEHAEAHKLGRAARIA